MAKKRKTKVLYFITGPQETDEQRAEIEAMAGIVCIRNANVIHDGDPIEDFDHVAGDVPEAYARAAALKEAEAADAPEAPKADTSAPAAPQQAKTGTAKPTGATPASAWKPN